MTHWLFIGWIALSFFFSFYWMFDRNESRPDRIAPAISQDAGIILASDEIDGSDANQVATSSNEESISAGPSIGFLQYASKWVQSQLVYWIFVIASFGAICFPLDRLHLEFSTASKGTDRIQTFFAKMLGQLTVISIAYWTLFFVVFLTQQSIAQSWISGFVLIRFGSIVYLTLICALTFGIGLSVWFRDPLVSIAVCVSILLAIWSLGNWTPFDHCSVDSMIDRMVAVLLAGSDSTVKNSWLSFHPILTILIALSFVSTVLGIVKYSNEDI